MTALKREGMGPLSPEFAEACRCVADDAPSKRGYHPLPPSTTRAEFREALSVVGIEDARQLADALGLNVDDPRSARGILADPVNRYTSKHADKLRSIVENAAADANRAAIDTKEAARAEAEARGLNPFKADMEARDAARDELDEARRVGKAREILLGDAEVNDWFDALRLEFALRALVEGAMALNDEEVNTLLRVLWGLLETKPLLPDDAAAVAGSLERYFRGISLGGQEEIANLAALIVEGNHERDASGDFIEHNLAQAALNEYCGFPLKTE